MSKKIDYKEYLIDNKVDINIGLDDDQVILQIQNGKVNKDTVVASRTTKEIVIKNVVTLFNILNLFLVCIVIYTRSFRNILFAGALISNAIIGITQELKSRRLIEKLSFLSQKNVSVVRGGSEVEVDKKDIVVNDILVLKKGMKIPVDVICLESGIMVDESLITGEAEAVEKKEGDLIYSGSLVIQGMSLSQVYLVGKNTYISKLTMEAKVYKASNSKIQKYTRKILNIITFFVIPLIAIILINQFFFLKSTNVNESLLGMVAAISGMLPEGLVLLTSVAFAAGVIKLSMYNTITQDLPAIETLARVDVICIDKTGTITEGKMSVDDVVYYGDKEKIDDIMSFLLKNDIEQNMSTEALKKYFNKDSKHYEIIKYYPFASETKWQAIELKKEGTYILGAFDILDNKSDKNITKEANQYVDKGFRVLAFAHTKSEIKNNKVPKDSKIISLIFIKDKVKIDAKEILEYFKEQDVTIKVLSGDHPNTIKSIAAEVGLHGNALNHDEIPIDFKKLRDCVEDTAIFGRVVPEQKREIVKALQANGHTVAMIGDGINDILAMKQSDCAVAFVAGSEATRSIAQFVLLTNDFSTLPEVVRQGRKMINNMNRAAGLYLVRVIYSFLLSLVLLFISKDYPLQPITLSAVSTLGIGIPSWLLTFEKNEHKAKDDYLKRILINAIPTGLTIAFSLIFIILFKVDDMSAVEIRTVCTLVIGTIQMALLYLLCKPLTFYRRLVVLGMILAFYISYFIPPLNYLLGITYLNGNVLNAALPILLVAVPILMLIHWFLRKYVVKLVD